MLIFLIVTIIICGEFLISLAALYRIRSFAMNPATKQHALALLKGSLIIFLGAVIEAATWLRNEPWWGLVASVVVLTGTAMYFNTLQRLEKNQTISYDKADLVQLIMWVFWVLSFINVIIHSGIVWIY